MRPPVVKHKGRRCVPEEMDELIGACADNIHLTSGGRRLLYFYATCYGGFRPAKKLIEKQTGINSVHLYEYKKELRDLGLISVDKETRAISIDWWRIRLYSTLDPAMTDRYRRHTTISHHSKYSGKKIGTLSGRFVQRAVGRKLTPGQRHFYHALDDMTEFEWNTILWSMGVNVGESMDITADPEPRVAFTPVEPEYKNYYGEISLPF